MSDLYLIGLGNPGEQYQYNRHNVGFIFLDYVQKQLRSSDFSLLKKEWPLLASTGNLGEHKIILVKPLTFMNKSGDAISVLKNYYKIAVEQFLVVFDDKDMEFPKLRYREEGSSGGHNGVKSLISVLGLNFARYKIGVADSHKLAYQDTADFVLSNFSSEERRILQEKIFPELWTQILEKFT
ncbi:MAG TPA: aminoacyl-tRNA hydrolase [Candidatus Gracilibacteria bacterium]|nr:aminoacyl-tRNA hydrolase [Candidatus Gracilibacteria bacterium]